MTVSKAGVGENERPSDSTDNGSKALCEWRVVGGGNLGVGRRNSPASAWFSRLEEAHSAHARQSRGWPSKTGAELAIDCFIPIELDLYQ